MKEIKQRKERRFLKTLGKVGEILIQEVLIKIGSNLIKKIGGKKTLPSILFLLASLSLFAQYPNTGNKQRLGFQTTGDGLVYRGRASDTTTIKSSGLNNAYFILDTVNNIQYNYIKTKGGWVFSNGDTVIINNNFTQPVDSLFFNVGVPTNNVDTAKMRWDSDLATVVLGLNDNVPNELGFKNFWLVKNQTGATITKGSLVYANGTVGASGRITVAKFIANGSIDAKYLLGITAHDLTDGEDGYVISFGKIRQVNTDTFAAGAILYPSPTVAGVWTDIEPVAPNIDMPIGFCINSSSNNGTIAIRVASGYKLSELHDVAISSPVNKASLYYTGGLWRDTTAALLVSDTSSMLTPYLRKLDTISLSNRINLKLNISDTASMLTPYFRDADTTSLNLTSRFAAKLNISDTASMLTPYLRKLDTVSLSNRINLKVNISDTLNMLAPYLRKADTTNMLLPYFRDADTTQLNLTSRFAAKLNLSDTASMLINYLRTGTAASTYLTQANAASTYLPLTGGTLSGDLGISKSSNSILRLSSADVGSYGKLIFSSNNGFYLNYGASIESSGDGVGVDVGSLNFLTGFGTVRTNRMTITPSGNLTIVNSATIGGTLGITGATTLTGGINGNIKTNGAAGSTATPDNIWLGNSFSNGTTRDKLKIYLFNNDTEKYGFGVGGASDIQYHSNGTHDFYIANTKKFFISNTNTTTDNIFTVNNAAVFNEASTDSDFRVESDGNANMVFVDASTDRVGIGTNAPDKTLHVNGEVKIATVTATPTALLGKDGSNVVGTVTTVAQTGIMKAGGTTTNTSSVGIITVAHGLPYTPSQVFVTLAQQSSYVIVCHSITSSNMLFTVYDSITGLALDNVSVGFFWLAIK